MICSKDKTKRLALRGWQTGLTELTTPEEMWWVRLFPSGWFNWIPLALDSSWINIPQENNYSLIRYHECSRIIWSRNESFAPNSIKENKITSIDLINLVNSWNRNANSNYNISISLFQLVSTLEICSHCLV